MLRPYISGPLGLGSYAAQPVAQPRFQLLRFVAELQGLADRADVLKHLVERVRVQRDDPRGGHESRDDTRDRKSTRLNSSHSQISYAVFCLKKKKHRNQQEMLPPTIRTV